MEKKIIYQPKIRKLKILDWVFIAGITLFALSVITIRPVPILPEKDLMVLNGKVTDIYEGSVKDLNLRLEGRNEMFYVNRGLERGLNLQELRVQLINQNITIKYPDQWSLLDPNKRTIHISKIEHQGQTVFTEVN